MQEAKCEDECACLSHILATGRTYYRKKGGKGTACPPSTMQRPQTVSNSHGVSNRTIELLSPAQNVSCGIAALRAGADAVYIGAPRFGARSKAGNSIEEIESLCATAHLFGARVYATLNTLLYDNELAEAEHTALALYQAGVDAYIIQDMAWLALDLPPLPLHASTQTDNRTLEKVDFLYRSGCDRVVLARELSTNAIAAIHQHEPKVELEAFVHGALCVSYSGQCYLSQKLFGRSANRGECAQACRLPYRIEDLKGHTIRQRAYALSLRDLNLSNNLDALIDAGVSSLKIEGRMKGTDYVENVTAFYHQRLNEIIASRPTLQRASQGHVEIPFTPDPQATFARPFTTYFSNNRPAQLVNLDTPKSVGEPIGKVLSTGNGWIEIENAKLLTNGDGIIFICQGEAVGCRVNRTEGSRIYTFRLARTPRPGDYVYRNANARFSQAITQYPASRTLELHATLAWDGLNDATLSAQDENGITASIVVKAPLEKAKQMEKQAAVWQQQMAKTTQMYARIISVRLPDNSIPFLPQSTINALRRELIDKYLAIRLASYKRPTPHASKAIVAYPNSLPSDGRLNVSNHLAKEFYAARGIPNAPAALDLQKEIPQNVELMRTKYCLRYELSLCPRQHPRAKPTPLILQSRNHRLLVEFDCKRCEMVIREI